LHVHNFTLERGYRWQCSDWTTNWKMKFDSRQEQGFFFSALSPDRLRGPPVSCPTTTDSS